MKNLSIRPLNLNLLILLSFFFVFTVYFKLTLNQYANSTQSKLVEMLSYDLAKGDLLQIGNKMSNQLFLLNWTCLNVMQDHKTFFQRDNGNCNQGFNIARLNISKIERPDIKIELYLKLPIDQQVTIFITFIILAVITFLFIRNNNSYHSKVILMEKDKVNSVKEISYKIAHDIQSPLQILKFLGERDFSNKELAIKAIDRIDGISKGLLLERKKEKIESIDLLRQIEMIISEKKALFPELKLLLAESDHKFFAQASVDEFQAIISNLLNNSIEAKASQIIINFTIESNEIILQISDNGNGISPELLEKLMSSQVSEGKLGGNGIGLYQAKKAILAWGGNIKIDSVLNQGTTITIKLKI